MRLEFRITAKEGYEKIIDNTAGLRFINEFGILRLSEGREFSQSTNGCEVMLLILEGKCTVSVDSKSWENLGKRNTVFEGKPTAVYISPGSRYKITGYGAEIAVCKSEAKNKREATLILPESVETKSIGRDNWQREVRVIAGPTSITDRIILGETINPPGNWSGTPPHKHDVDDMPNESLHEELYYFRIDKPQGWGYERIYNQDKSLDQTIILEDRIVTIMPEGYHQIVAAPGYTIYYLFFLSGPDKKLIPVDDPEHSWIKHIKGK